MNLDESQDTYKALFQCCLVEKHAVIAKLLAVWGSRVLTDDQVFAGASRPEGGAHAEYERLKEQFLKQLERSGF